MPSGAGFLESLSSPQRAALEELGRRRRFPAGAPLFREDDEGGAVYLLLAGWVKITVSGVEGREVLLGVRGAGELLGELAVLGERGRSSTVTAAEPVEALVVPASAFRAWVERHPGVALILLAITVERLFRADRRAIEFASLDVLGRVEARLRELAEASGRAVPDGREITIPLTQEELASWIGASREAVSRALTQLGSLGRVRVERRRITVLDAG